MALRLRIMASMAFISLVLVVISAIGFHLYVNASTMATLQRILHARALRAQQALGTGRYTLSNAGESARATVDQSIVQIVSRQGQLRYTTVAAGTRVLLPSGAIADISVPRFQQVMVPGKKNALLILAEPAKRTPGEVIVVGTSTDQIHDSVSLLDQLLWGLGGLAIVLTVVGAGVAATFVLHPVERMQRQAVALSGSGLHGRLVDPGTHDELASLADTLNRFLDELAASGETRERFIASASHELRTPLAGMRAELETRGVAKHSSDEALLQRLERRVEHLSTLTEGLLAIAEGQVGVLPLQRSAIDLESVVATALSRIVPVAARSNLVLVLDSDGVPPVTADVVRIGQVVENLVSNAVNHAPNGSIVTVGLSQAGAGVSLSVRDQGSGLPEGLGRTVFEPFVRGHTERHAHPGGSGLGLSIVELIVSAHGGIVTLENHPCGGAIATVWLPSESCAPHVDEGECASSTDLTMTARAHLDENSCRTPSHPITP